MKYARLSDYVASQVNAPREDAGIDVPCSGVAAPLHLLLWTVLIWLGSVSMGHRCVRPCCRFVEPKLSGIIDDLCRRIFDQHHLMPRVSQPIREGRTSDADSVDDHSHCRVLYSA